MDDVIDCGEEKGNCISQRIRSARKRENEGRVKVPHNFISIMFTPFFCNTTWRKITWHYVFHGIFKGACVTSSSSKVQMIEENAQLRG